MAVSDNFNRANGALGANWTTDSNASFSALTIVSNACQGSTGGAHNVAVYTAGGTVAANQYAQCKVTATGGFIGTVLRSNGAGTFYVCYYSAGAATIYKWIAGSAGSLTSGTTITPAVNDVIYFEAVGTALTFKVNGVTVASATDGAITGAGYTGIDIYDTAGAVDDFAAGAVGEVIVSLVGIAATPAIGAGTVSIGSVDVVVSLVGVAANPQIGAGTVQIEGGVVPPVDTGGGGTGRSGMRLRPSEDIRLYLEGVAANPRIGRVMLRSDLERVYEGYSAPIRRAAVQKPAEMPPGMRELFKKQVPPALFVYRSGFPKLKSAVGSGTVKAHYEEIDEEVLALLDLL